jgi:thioredoxin-related protein
MKKFFAVLLLTGLFAGALFAATPKGWTSDFEAAKVKAANENRLMYVLFTGSDWCGYCIKLQKEVLSKPKFKKLGEKDFVFVYIDFPRKSRADNPMANRVLAKMYNVQGFPTAFVMDPNGKVLTKIVGALPMKQYIKKLETVRQANPVK